MQRICKTLISSLSAVILLTLLSCSSPTGNNGKDDPTNVPGFTDETYFTTSGTEILNRQGNPVVIKGFGLGGWLLPEGYMFNITHPAGEGASEIYAQVEELIGASETEQWINDFRDNYVTEEDIKLMKSWGADHIRVPFHYNIFYDIDTGEFNEDGFDRMNTLLVWCKRNRMDVILDMHAAPGAQSDGPIADSDGEARFWTESDTYWPITIKIWKEIARRYKDETIIIGYDLLNEPVTPSPYDNTDLARFYSQIIEAVRKIDKDHILFIEGNYWATTFDYLYPPMDDNMVYAFHKYWNETDQGTIQYLLNLRDEYDVPLWLGESGENSNPWFYETIALMERNNIGWNWWTHKKLETITSPLSAPTNPDYDKVLSYWKNEGARPTAQEARQGLFQMVEDLKLENNIHRPDVVAALFSPTFNSSNEPYTDLVIPGTIHAANYDIGNNGVSYYDHEYKRVGSDDDQNAGNSGWGFRNDGVDIESSDDPASEYNVGWTEDGEWIEYTVTTTAGTYDISAYVSTPSNGSELRIKLDERTIVSGTQLPGTGGYQNWRKVNLGEHEFEDGTSTLRIEILSGGFNISRLVFN
jgi:aryl-phospho-beta-D-glucosidase BglC (GH1 family)